MSGQSGGSAEFLVRTVLDPEFRALALRAPDEAFAGFDLSEEEKDALRRRDEGMLGLLGAALRRPAVEPSADDAGGPSPAPTPPTPPAATPAATPASAGPVQLPTLSFQLNVEPSLLQTPEGLRVTCAVSMQPVDPSRPSAAGAPASPWPAAARGEPIPWSAWDHDLGSERTRAAVAAVRSASAGERLGRVLDLVAAITRHERIGGRDG